MSYTQGTWNTGEQIRDHKLACSIINLHRTVDEVFDDECLAELERFTLNRSVAARDDFLRQRDFVGDDETNQPGKKAASHGSLTGYLIGRYETSDPALDERDWELLEDWFRKGTPVGENVSR